MRTVHFKGTRIEFQEKKLFNIVLPTLWLSGAELCLFFISSIILFHREKLASEPNLNEVDLMPVYLRENSLYLALETEKNDLYHPLLISPKHCAKPR